MLESNNKAIDRVNRFSVIENKSNSLKPYYSIYDNTKKEIYIKKVEGAARVEQICTLLNKYIFINDGWNNYA